jgi:small subunit ribosomal protein S16
LLKIRLSRVGKKKQPSYRVVIADARAPRDGAYVDIVGHYNPLTQPKVVEIDADKVKDWLSKGAQPTERVERLLAAQGLVPTRDWGAASAAAAAKREATRRDPRPAAPAAAAPAAATAVAEPPPAETAEAGEPPAADAPEAVAEAEEEASIEPLEDANEAETEAEKTEEESK